MEEKVILYILGSYPRWSETFVRQDLQMLLDEGMPLLPVCLFPGDVERRPEWPRVRCLTPSDRSGASRNAGSPGGGHRWTRWLPPVVRTHVSRIKHRGLYRALRDIALESGVRHVHAEFADLPAVLGAKLAGRCGLSYSVGVHARDVHTLKYSPSAVYGPAAFISVCNTDTRDALANVYPEARSRLQLIHHGLDLRAWPFREERVSLSSPMKLLFAGRLVPKKGVSVLFRAMARMKAAGMSSQLRLMGSGPMEQELRQEARELGITDQLTWSGVVSGPEVRSGLLHGECLVMPSVQDSEGDQDGIPNIVVEAMASGTPVAASTAGSLPEVVSDETGWPFTPDDDDALAETLCRMQLAPDQVDDRRCRARQLVVQDFDARLLVRVRAELFRKAFGLNHEDEDDA